MTHPLMPRPTDSFSLHNADRLFVDMCSPAAIKVLLDLKVLDFLPGPSEADGKTILHIIREVETVTSQQRNVLQAALDILVCTGLLLSSATVVGGDIARAYRNSAKSLCYRTGTPGYAFLRLLSDNVVNSISQKEKLSPSLPMMSVDKQWGSNTSEHSVFGNLGKEKLESFFAGMTAMESFYPLLDQYNLDSILADHAYDPHRLVIVDVGGGNGHFLSAWKERYPDLPSSRMAIAERHEVLQWLRASPTRGKGFMLIEHDFFYDWPQSCVGAYVYNIRLCLHNWGDDDCVQILLHLAKAMAYSSKLCIAEVVRPSMSDDSSNMISAMHFAMVGMGGKLRTSYEWLELLGKAGLCLEEIRYENEKHGWAVLHISKKLADTE